MILGLIALRQRQPSGLRRGIVFLALGLGAGVAMTPELGMAGSCEQGVQLYERLSASIVRIEARHSGNIFAPPQLGSGVVIGHGLIATADHVVAGADEIWVLGLAEQKQRAEIVRRHPEADLTLIQLASARVPPALALSDDPPARAGQCVAALGNVMHGGVGIFCGMVSMIGPSLPGGAGQILTDIVAPPGLSGGALVDCETREVLGIVTFGLVDLKSASSTAGLIGAAPAASVQDLLEGTVGRSRSRRQPAKAGRGPATQSSEYATVAWSGSRTGHSSHRR